MQDGGLIRLMWIVDSSGYEIVERRGSTVLTDQVIAYIVPRGGKPRAKEIGLQETKVLRDLANARTPVQAVAFAKQWGLLYQPYNDSAKPRKGEMVLQQFLAISESLRASDAETKKRLFERSPEDADLYKIFCDLYGEDVAAKKFGIDDHGVANLRVVIHKGRLALRPFNLLQFCWMQRLQALLPRAGAADVSRCLACGDYVVHNARQGRPSNYCSDACKYRQWRKNKKLKKTR
jgi:hypothetical protein